MAWHILLPIHSLLPGSAASPDQCVWYIQPSQVPKAANLPLLKARWARLVSHWYDHLAAMFIPSIGLEDMIALATFTKRLKLWPAKPVPLEHWSSPPK